MTDEAPDALYTLFRRACDLSPEARAALLEEVEVHDADLGSRLRELLAADVSGGKLPPESMAGPIPTSVVAEALGRSPEGHEEVLRDELSWCATPAGRYVVGEEIGQGGMGLVHVAWDRLLHRHLARKTLRAGRPTGSEAQELARFLQEARVTGCLEHPGVVPVHDLGLDADGRVFFTMRRVDGETLQELLDTAGRAEEQDWPLARLLGVLQRVCEAMGFAHAQGVLHRDLKPANVMVGRFGEVYVMDWGVAKVGDGPACDVRVDDGASGRPRDREAGGRDGPGASDAPLLSRAGTVIGTPAYMPPEQAASDRDELGPHSDVYAVGAMLYQLLTRRMPYAPDGEPRAARELLAALRAGPPAPVSELAPRTPPELVAICERAMARSPRDRYPDMGAMADDLRAFLEHRVVAAYESGTWAEVRKWLRRNRTLAASVAAGLLATTALGFVLAWQQRRAAEEIAAERDRSLLVGSFLRETLEGVKPSVAKGRDTAMLREMLEAAVARMDEGQLEGSPLAEAQMRHSIGMTLMEIGEARRAREQLERAVEVSRGRPELFGDLELANALDTYGVVLTTLDEHDRAAEVLEEAHAIRRRAAAPESEDVASSLNNLALLAMRRGDHAASKRLFEECVALRRRLFPDGSRTLAVALANLGYVLLARAEYGEAESVLDEAMDISGRLEPGTVDHGRLVMIRARLHQEVGEWDRAEELFLRALEGFRGLLDGPNEHTALALANLGAFCEETGRFAEAEGWLRQALAMQTELLGERNETTATTIHNLALIMKRLGDLEESDRLYRRAIAIRRALFPGGSQSLAQSLHNHAVLLEDRFEPDAAMERYLEALEMRRRVFAGDHPELALSLDNVGRQHLHRGDGERALQLQTEALEMNRRIFGDTPNLATVDVLDHLVETLLATGGDLDLVEAYAADALAQRRAIQGETNPAVADTARLVGTLAFREGRLDDALAHLQLARDALAGRPDQEATLASLDTDVGRCLLLLGRHGEAEARLLDARAVYDDLGWGPAPESRYNLDLLVDLYTAWERADPGAGHDASRARWEAERAGG